MDECIPPVIRDRKWFMYPFYCWAYRGKNIGTVMDFKKKYFEWNEQELQQFYENIRSISSDRNTDVSANGIRMILDQCRDGIGSVLDVGCGKGYMLRSIRQAYPGIPVHGTDFVARPDLDGIPFTKAEATRLPLADKSFDLVLSSHTIEHIHQPEKLVKELRRIARKKIIVITPKQRYFYYTLDEHINFFPHRELLTGLMGLSNYECSKVDGDWVYIGYLTDKD